MIRRVSSVQRQITDTAAAWLCVLSRPLRVIEVWLNILLFVSSRHGAPPVILDESSIYDVGELAL